MERLVKLAVLLSLLAFSVSVNVGLFILGVRAQTWVEGHITEDTAWTLADSPYRVINDVIVDPGILLTIEPGVEVQFADSFSLIVEGSLTAVGTDVNPIVFTSSRASPSPGVWGTIKFRGNSSEQFLLRHAKVEYAVHGVTVESPGLAKIEKSEILICSDSGIVLIGNNVNLTITQNAIKYNKNGIATISSNTLSGITITWNEISSNQENGIYLLAQGGETADIYNVNISSNVISINGKNGIYLSSVSADYSYIHDVIVMSNVISSNEENGIFLYTKYWTPIGDAKIYNVTVLSNTVLGNNGEGIKIFGDDDVIFDVTILSNKVSSNGLSGVWIYGRSYVYNVTIASNAISSNNANGIKAKTNNHYSGMSDLVILDNVISANQLKGIELLEDVNANLSHNSISLNLYGIVFEKTTTNIAKYNDIYDNFYGMNVTYGATVNAEYNYWGHSTGPYHLSLNPEGQGNSVNGDGTDLDFIPFLTSPIGTINQRPVAVLEVDKTTSNVDEIVTFDASASTDDGRIDYCFFDFGDGTNSSWTTLSVVKHNYTSLGVYNASLVVMDDFGVQSINPANVTITVAEELPQLIVSLSINPTSITSEGQVSINAHVTNGTVAIQGVLVEFISDKGGTFSPLSGPTDSNGDFAATFTAPTVSEQTDVRITATASKIGYADGSDYKYLSVLPPGAVSLSVTITANPNVVQSGQTSTITVQVTDGIYPIADASVTLSSDQGETLSPTSGYTNSSGHFTSTYTAPTVIAQTTITLTATAAKTGYLDGEGQTQITVGTATLSVSITASVTTMLSGETSTISIRVTSDGNPISGATVTLSSDKGGTFTPNSGTTDSNGDFTTTFTTPSVTSQTTVKITATATKTGYLNGQDQTQITVNPGQQPSPSPSLPDQTLWIYIVIVVIVLVTIGGGVAIARRKRIKT